LIHIIQKVLSLMKSIFLKIFLLEEPIEDFEYMESQDTKTEIWPHVSNALRVSKDKLIESPTYFRHSFVFSLHLLAASSAAAPKAKTSKTAADKRKILGNQKRRAAGRPWTLSLTLALQFPIFLSQIPFILCRRCTWKFALVPGLVLYFALISARDPAIKCSIRDARQSWAKHFSWSRVFIKLYDMNYK